MPFSQAQIRDFYIATITAAASAGRTNEIAYVAELNGVFAYTIDATAAHDGKDVLTAAGTNAFWKRVTDPTPTVIGYPRVANHTALLALTGMLTGDIYVVETPEGTFLNAKKAGLYRYDGTSWVHLNVETESVSDTLFNIYNAIDNTKNVKFDVAKVAPATQRTVFLPDADVELHKNNLVAIVAPVAADDVAAGYSVGSRWVDLTTNSEYVCVDSSTGAAVWKSTTAAAAGVGLPPKGILPVTITSQGIYTADGSFSTSTLYPATGSQDRVYITTVGSIITIKVPASDSLYGSTIPGQQTINLPGETLLFIDVGVNQWAMQKLSDRAQTIDHATSSYMDIGTMRIQWGSRPTGAASVITLPALFLNTGYAVTASANVAATSGTAVLAVQVTARTTSTFTAEQRYANMGTSGAAAEGYDWMAIGIKP